MEYATRGNSMTALGSGYGRARFDISLCAIEHCKADAADGVGILLCQRHLQKAWAAYQITMGAEVPGMKPEPAVDTNALTTPGVVYVVRIGEFIKIGWTRNFKQRMSSLKPDAMLHFKQGTRKDEYKLQAQFLDYLAKGREWFECCDETIAMVENLRSGKLAA